MNIRLSTKRALADVDKTQSWLAEQVGINRHQLSRWVNSDSLNTDSIERMARPFGLTIVQFIELGERDAVLAAGAACCGGDE